MARVDQIVRTKAAGCCGDDSWRGRFCEYHRGYEAAWLEMAEQVQAIEHGG